MPCRLNEISFGVISVQPLLSKNSPGEPALAAHLFLKQLLWSVQGLGLSSLLGTVFTAWWRRGHDGQTAPLPPTTLRGDGLPKGEAIE